MWNRLYPGKTNDERRQSLGASWNCRPTERSENGHTRVLPSCPRGLRSVLKMFRFPSSSGSARTSPALERLELCEAKVSCTVLIRFPELFIRWRGERVEAPRSE